ncbi:hypothetical protein J3F84DRAFT_173889 [Trichoderma pleuroticola]
MYEYGSRQASCPSGDAEMLVAMCVLLQQCGTRSAVKRRRQHDIRLALRLSLSYKYEVDQERITHIHVRVLSTDKFVYSAPSLRLSCCMLYFLRPILRGGRRTRLFSQDELGKIVEDKPCQPPPAIDAANDWQTQEQQRIKVGFHWDGIGQPVGNFSKAEGGVLWGLSANWAGLGCHISPLQLFVPANVWGWDTRQGFSVQGSSRRITSLQVPGCNINGILAPHAVGELRSESLRRDCDREILPESWKNKS